MIVSCTCVPYIYVCIRTVPGIGAEGSTRYVIGISPNGLLLRSLLLLQVAQCQQQVCALSHIYDDDKDRN